MHKIGRETGNSYIYTMLKRHGWRKVMLRAKHPKKADDEAIEASKISDTVRLLAIQNQTKRIRLMFQDEAGFGRINKAKRCWCKRGHRPSVPCHHIREYWYVMVWLSR